MFAELTNTAEVAGAGMAGAGRAAEAAWGGTGEPKRKGGASRFQVTKGTSGVAILRDRSLHDCSTLEVSLNLSRILCSLNCKKMAQR